MDLTKVGIASVGSIVVLFFLTKLLGYKQMSELSMFDYVNGITIGSIAAEMATTIDGDFMKPLLAMVIYAVAAFAMGIVSAHSLGSGVLPRAGRLSYWKTEKSTRRT